MPILCWWLQWTTCSSPVLCCVFAYMIFSIWNPHFQKLTSPSVFILHVTFMKPSLIASCAHAPGDPDIPVCITVTISAHFSPLSGYKSSRIKAILFIFVFPTVLKRRMKGIGYIFGELSEGKSPHNTSTSHCHQDQSYLQVSHLWLVITGGDLKCFFQR